MPQLTPFTKEQLEKFKELFIDTAEFGDKLDNLVGAFQFFLSTALQEQQQGFMEAIKSLEEGMNWEDKYLNSTILLEELKKKGLI